VKRCLVPLALVVALAAVAQAAVPSLVSAALAAQLERVTGSGSRDRVTVQAWPFWTLAAGRFQSLAIDVRHWRAGPLTVADASVDWRGGGVDVATLLRHHTLVPTRVGHIVAVVTVDQVALAQWLERTGRARAVSVKVEPRAIAVTGFVNFHGLAGRVTLRGGLTLSRDRQQILFVPDTVQGIRLPFRVALPVFDLASLNVPVPLVLDSVRLDPPHVVVVARSP
jgi:hypothetical protein